MSILSIMIVSKINYYDRKYYQNVQLNTTQHSGYLVFMTRYSKLYVRKCGYTDVCIHNTPTTLNAIPFAHVLRSQ